MQTRTRFTLLDAGDGMRVVARLNVRREQPLIRRQALHGPTRRAALVGETAVVLGAWDDWANARTVPVAPRRWTFAAFTEGGRTLVLFARGPVVRVDVDTLAVTETGVDDGHFDGPLAFDAASGRLLHVRRHVAPFVADAGDRAWRAAAADPSRVTVAVGTPDGRALVTASAGGVIRLRDRVTFDVLTQMEAPPGEAADLAVSPDGRELFAPGQDALLRWSLATGEAGEPVALAQPWPSAARRVALSRSGRHAVVWSRHPSGSERCVSVIDLAAGASRRWTPPASSSSVEVVAVLDGDLPLRVARTLSGPGLDRVQEIAASSFDGGRFEPTGRWLDDDPYVSTLARWSRDGRLLWRARSHYREGTQPAHARPAFTVTSVGPAATAPIAYFAGPLAVWVADADAARTTFARWEVAGREVHGVAGRALLALTTETDESAHALWVFSAGGGACRTDWAGACVPLAFAPDDRALWVRDDASGLVLELAVPHALAGAAPP